MADIELDANPQSTWGANDDYKNAWHAKYGSAEPAGNAAKAEWVEYAVKQGAVPEDAEGMTVADLKASYSGSGVAAAPTQSPINVSSPPGGAEGNVETDPMKKDG